ncbi:hypothetical protein A9Q81_08680 [Gammaproteobacteria bacterium 42_54_T18]|nr:hypothetical protein A9Q81_08680 [Gammaproteobacteria bacterium 42_54_T18]
MKIFLLMFFLCSFFQSSFAYSVDIDDAKDQVFNLLNIIEERNEILKKRFPNVEEDTQSNSGPLNTTKDVELSDANSLAFLNGIRDPFSATKKIVDTGNDGASSDDEGSAYSGYDFKSPGLAVKLPKLSLKGVVYKQSESDPLALLDVAGHGVYMVRLEDEIGFNFSDPSQVIKIKKINRLNIVVEVGSLGDLIVVR